MRTIAHLPYFVFMVITQELVNHHKNHSLSTHAEIGILLWALRNLPEEYFEYIYPKKRRNRLHQALQQVLQKNFYIK